MQDLVMIRVGLEWLALKPKRFCVYFKGNYPYWCRHAPNYHHTVCYKL